MSEKQAAAARREEEKDWDVDKIWERVRAASLKDPVVARYAAFVNKPATSQEEQGTQATPSKIEAKERKIKAKERYPIKFRKHPPPPKKKSWGKSWGSKVTNKSLNWNKIERLKARDVEIGQVYHFFSIKWKTNQEGLKVLSINPGDRLTVQGVETKEITNIHIRDLRKPDKFCSQRATGHRWGR